MLIFQGDRKIPPVWCDMRKTSAYRGKYPPAHQFSSHVKLPQASFEWYILQTYLV